MASQEETTSEQKTPETESAAESTSDSGTGSGLREQLEAAIAERDANREQWLRSEAELENYRKRVRKENEELLKFQSLFLARDLLPGLDNLDRAITAAEESGNVEDLMQGIRMVSQQFREVFSRHAIEAISAKEQPFDPNLHEAVQQIPSADHPPMTVLEELETGYRMHDRVIRPSKVLVSAPPLSPSQDEDRETK